MEERKRKRRKGQDYRSVFGTWAGVKSKCNEVWNYIKKSDIIGITESWIDQKEWENSSEEIRVELRINDERKEERKSERRCYRSRS